MYRRGVAPIRGKGTTRGTVQSSQSTGNLAIAGIAAGFGLYFFGFLVIGGEWFQMWQSATWNGQEAAFRFAAVFGLVLIYVSMEDGDPWS